MQVLANIFLYGNASIKKQILVADRVATILFTKTGTKALVNIMIIKNILLFAYRTKILYNTTI